jgi:hypothetical protein
MLLALAPLQVVVVDITIPQRLLVVRLGDLVHMQRTDWLTPTAMQAVDLSQVLAAAAAVQLARVVMQPQPLLVLVVRVTHHQSLVHLTSTVVAVVVDHLG